jgi:hypothetical protein
MTINENGIKPTKIDIAVLLVSFSIYYFFKRWDSIEFFVFLSLAYIFLVAIYVYWRNIRVERVEMLVLILLAIVLAISMISY